MSDKLRYLFFGTAEFATTIFSALLPQKQWELLGVVTQPDKPHGRSKALIPSAMAQAALAAQVPLYRPARLSEFFPTFQELAPDFVILVAYGKILPDNYLALPQFGFINVHPSLLPLHRGASPIQYTILDGDAVAGTTIMTLEATVDAGPIIAQSAPIPCEPTETTATLSAKLATVSAELLIAALPDYLAGKKPQPQDHSKATFTKIIKKEDGHIDWTQSAVAIDRRIRAFTPWPGCSTILDEQVLKVLHARPIAASLSSRQPAGIMHVANGNLVVSTGDGDLEILALQVAGKKPTTAAAFINGYGRSLPRKVA